MSGKHMYWFVDRKMSTSISHHMKYAMSNAHAMCASCKLDEPSAK